MDPLLVALRTLRRRLLVTRWTRSTVYALIGACTGSLAWLILTRMFPALGGVELVAASLAAAAIAGATAWAIWKRPSLVQTALEADRRLGLNERLTSSLELADSDAPMVRELHADARTQLARLDVRREFPFATPRAIRWLAIPLVLFCLGYVLLPEFDLFNFRERQAEAKAREDAVRVEAERLLAAVQPLRELPEQVAGEFEGIAEGVERIAEGLEAGQITEKQAVARLTNLAKLLEEEHQKLATETPIPRLNGDTSKLTMAKEVANNIQNGDFGKAGEKLQDLMQKLQAGELSEQAQDQLESDLNELAKILGGEDSALGEALADIAAGLKMQDKAALQAALEKLDLTLDDLKSLMEQMAKLQQCQIKFGECENKLYCSACQGICKGGNCPGNKFAVGPYGLRGPGRGRGNQIGELPDVEASFDPKMLSGDMTKGKILASIMQRAAPTDDAESTIEYSEQALVQVKQQAEEALTREEIPPGSREFVRQYFGSLEPESETEQRTNPAPGP